MKRKCCLMRWSPASTNRTLTKSRRKELETAADLTFEKDKRINIRISNRDLIAIQSRAIEEGIPYQTLVSSIIHKYISGSLQDLTASKSGKPGTVQAPPFPLLHKTRLFQASIKA